MRVLMSADTVGGVYTYALELISALAEHGVAVQLATFGRRPSADQRRRALRAGAQELHETELALEWMADPWDEVAAGRERLVELEARLGPDVVHLNGYAHGAAPFRAPVLVAAHSCVCSWWEAVHGAQAPPEWDRYRHEVRRGIARADALVAPSRAMLAAVERHHGPLPQRAAVIPNGIAAAESAADGPREPFALAAGRFWDEAKGLDALLAASRSKRLRGSVLIAGEGGELGHLDPAQLAVLRRRAAVFAAPARYEPFGLGVLEAARDGCALVLGDIASLRELWSGAARFVPPGDPEALAAAVGDLLDAPPVARRLGAAARERSRRFTASAMAAAYLNLYRELASVAVAA